MNDFLRSDMNYLFVECLYFINDVFLKIYCEWTGDICSMRRGKTFILDVDSFLLHTDDGISFLKFEV